MPAVDVFLSYHGPDRAAAARLRDQLLALGLRVFMDRTHLAPGLPFPEALERGLQACAAVVVLVGGKIGDWQKREIFVALERQDEEARAARAFPVLLPGADIRAAFLFANTWVDLREASNDAAPFEQLIGAIRNASVAAGTRAAVTDVCPFRGLDAFREEDAAFFHGRGAVVARLTKRVHERRLVAVVGSSGSGKSSLVMAGLLPALRRRRPPAPTWDAVVFKPGSDPCVSLVRALMHWQEPEADSFSRAQRADAHGRQLASGTTRFTTLLDELLPASGAERLLLVVDQFEELFTLTKDETQRTAFVQILLEAVEGGRVTPVLTLRSEFYPHAINVDPSGALATLIEDGVLNALTPDREQLGEAIARPAHLLGLTFRPPALVERMLNEVGSAPGRLPLLEYALQELWNRRDGTELTETAYDGIGGVARAIAQRADSEFEKLNATDREHARRVMVRLVRTTQSSEGLENTRERLDLASLHADARRVVQRFVDVRLLVTWRTVHVPAVLATPADGSQTAPPTVGEAVDTVEVAHEALIGAWGKLTEWLKADQDLRLWRQKLAPYVADWKQDSSNVLGKTLLAEARAQLAAQRGDLLDDEIACIEASAARWRRGAALASLGALLIAVLLATVGWLSLTIHGRLDLPVIGRLYALSLVIEPALLSIPGGAYVMGSPETEEGRGDDEGPQHRVAVAPFELGRTEVTFAEYDGFAQVTKRALPSDNGWGRGQQPVINVSYADAAWLSVQTGKAYRLATESEWEYAARSRSVGKYWWGDEVRRGREVMSNCDGCGSVWDNTQAAPVGRFAANDYGLQDMHGNVWEWTQDCRHENYENAPRDGAAWLEVSGGDCTRRVVRGGSWLNEPARVRSASRYRYDSGGANASLGFRLARTP